MAQNQGTVSQKVVINPYPLESGGMEAVHNVGQGGASPLDQAILEESGALKSVVTPGNFYPAGTIERARLAVRAPEAQTARYPAPQAFLPESAITPIPGGEGPPLPGSEIRMAAAQSGSVEKLTLPPYYKAAPVSGPAVAPIPVTPSSPVPAASTASSGFSNAVGFGKEIPLAIALSQVVPPSYSFAFAQNVDAGAIVSWEGGKPWDQVLSEMLAQSGMKAIIEKDQIVIANKNA